MAEPTSVKTSVVIEKVDYDYCDKKRINISRLVRELLHEYVGKEKAKVGG